MEKTGDMLSKEVEVLKDMIYVFREPIMTRFITVGNLSKNYMRSISMIVINPNKNLVGTQSASKFHPLFYGTFQKINLDRCLFL